MGKPTERSPYRLIVEGNADKFAVIELLAKRGYPWEDDQRLRPLVLQAGNDIQALDQFRGRLKDQEFSRVGLILDIDGDSTASSRRDAIRGRLRELDLGIVQEDIQPGKTFEVASGRRAGFWLMPDNQSKGAIEDFLEPLVPQHDVLWKWAPEVVSQAVQMGAPIGQKTLKSRLHSWLAWQQEPGLAFGLALKMGVLDPHHSSADPFVAWFRDLFPPDFAPSL